jgi:regulator of RNase E activity RraA
MPELAGLDTCAISDACDRLGLEGQVIATLSSLTGRQRIAGRAVTVLLGPPTQAVAERHLCTAAVEAAGRGDLIVVDHQGRLDCAGWGGNLSRAAKVRGIAGTIVHGAVRDIDEAVDIGYAVYATATTPRTARGRAHEHTWNVEINIAGVAVRPGDLVVADGTGIAVVPVEHADAVLELAARIADHEAAMATAIETNIPITTVMGATYEHMLLNRPPERHSEA